MAKGEVFLSHRIFGAGFQHHLDNNIFFLYYASGFHHNPWLGGSSERATKWSVCWANNDIHGSVLDLQASH